MNNNQSTYKIIIGGLMAAILYLLYTGSGNQLPAIPTPAPVTIPTAIAPQPLPVVEPAAAVQPETVGITAAPAVPVVPTRDWSPETTAVNRNLENAAKLAALCIQSKGPANCGAAIENLETARGLVAELHYRILSEEAGR